MKTKVFKTKFLLSGLTLTIIMCLFFFSCQKEEIGYQITPDNGSISKLIESFDNTINEIQSSDVNLDNDQIETLFISQAHKANLPITENVQLKSSKVYSASYVSFSQELEYAPDFETKEAFQSFLESLNSDVLHSDMSNDEKQDLVNKIAFMTSFVDWMESLTPESSSPHYAIARLKSANVESDDCDGWWDCWGKCVAGTVGTAGLGALGGLAVGGAGCTVVLPIIGTVACGTVGAVVGGVSGGLAGAAASC